MKGFAVLLSILPLFSLLRPPLLNQYLLLLNASGLVV